LKWSDSMKVSNLRPDLRMPGEGRHYWKQFDAKYPDLIGWGLYMYILHGQMIAYIGETSRTSERAFRQRAKEELLPPSKFCNEMKNINVDVDSLELKVAPVESITIDGKAVVEIDTKRLEKLLTCATAPLYDPHGPAHAKEDFDIHNSGNLHPLHECYSMKKGDECKCRSH